MPPTLTLLLILIAVVVVAIVVVARRGKGDELPPSQAPELRRPDPAAKTAGPDATATPPAGAIPASDARVEAATPDAATPDAGTPDTGTPDTAEAQTAETQTAETQTAEAQAATSGADAAGPEAVALAAKTPDEAAPSVAGPEEADDGAPRATGAAPGGGAFEAAHRDVGEASQEAPPEADAATEGEEAALEAPVEDARPAIESTYPPPPASRFPTRSIEEEVALLKKGLGKTRGGFVSRLTRLFRSKATIDEAFLDEVEEALITADIGVSTADRILTALRRAMEDGSLEEPEEVWTALRGFAAEVLEKPGAGELDLTGPRPQVVLVVGVNGVGKTTTIGKLAARLSAEGKRVLLAAGDTFRAAAVLQLEVWGRRTGCDVHKGKDKADPGSVVFDAIKKAQDEGYDVVIADTAGRLHTKSNLMDELAKVGRTLEKALGRPADEVLLVLDATTGQNAIQQAEIFRGALPLSGIALTKIDGTAKGGVILGIVDQHDLPVRYLGIGERVEDLRAFEAASFVEALLQPADDDAAIASESG